MLKGFSELLIESFNFFIFFIGSLLNNMLLFLNRSQLGSYVQLFLIVVGFGCLHLYAELLDGFR